MAPNETVRDTHTGGGLGPGHHAWAAPDMTRDLPPPLVHYRDPAEE